MSRQTLITFQPAPIVDHVLDDGTELTKLPYPVHAWAADGAVPSHLGGWTEARRIVGFVRDPDARQLDLPWREVADQPYRANGMYLVAQNRKDDGLFTLTSPVDTVERREFERPDVIDPLNAPVDSDHRWGRWTE